MGLFESLILNEALPQQQLVNPLQQKKKMKPPPTAAPPDLTKQQNDQNQQQQLQAPGQQVPQEQMPQEQDPNMGQDPTQQQGADMNAMGGDPNDPTMGADGREEQDPNAQGAEGDGTGEEGMEDPAMQGQEGELQAPQDPAEQDPKEKEQELFSSLKPEQMAIKQEELKSQYKNLYDSINGSLDKLKKVSHTTQDDHLLDFLVRKLLDTRDICRDSLIKTFDTKSYVENQIQLQRLIAVYSMITTLVSNVYIARVKREIAAEKRNNADSRRSPFLGPSVFERGIDVQ